MKCLICQEIITENKTEICCGGEYHLFCLKNWFQNELKCPICRKKLRKYRIYCAGKISKEREEYHQTNYSDYFFNEEVVQKDYQTFYYLGPFTTDQTYQKNCHGTNFNNNDNWKITEKCLEQIMQCNVMIVFINHEIDCYGTLLEMGYAYGQGKYIYLIFEENMKYSQMMDLWFAINLSKMSIFSGKQPKDDIFILVPFLQRWKNHQEYYQYLNEIPQKYSEKIEQKKNLIENID